MLSLGNLRKLLYSFAWVLGVGCLESQRAQVPGFEQVNWGTGCLESESGACKLCVCTAGRPVGVTM